MLIYLIYLFASFAAILSRLFLDFLGRHTGQFLMTLDFECASLKIVLSRAN